MQVTIKRPGDPATDVATVEIDERSLITRELMGADKIKLVFVVGSPVITLVGDFIEYDSRVYSLTEVPEVVKVNSKTFLYECVFNGEIYQLYDKMIMHLGRTNFSYTGTPYGLIALIVDNMQEYDAAWAIGDVEPISEPITFTFSEQSCRTALTQVADAFGLEYYVMDKEIFLIDEVGEDLGYPFRYGRDNGLYSLTRKAVDKAFATVWYGYGGTKNVPSTYRSGLGRITFDDSPVETNVATYGRKEGSVTFDDVYPSFTGEVDTAPSDFEITDSSIDFDLNDLFVTEGAAKIVFKTGDLGGNEFIITAYDHATKTVRFGVVEDETGYLLPNSVVKAAIGDKFTFVGIEMPSGYIDAAEAEVEARTIAWAAENSSPKVAYDLDIDEKYVRENAFDLAIVPGDKVNVIDPDLEVDEDVRVQSVEWPLVNHGLVKAVISDELLYTTAEKIVKDIRDGEKATDDAIRSALYARQVADEINNAALMYQFKRTYVGERCVLSGAFVAGNPDDGEVAGVNGAGSGPTQVRFWAGSSYDDRATAPFRVLQNGSAYATALEVANGCTIGDFTIESGYLRTADYIGQAGVLVSDGGILSRKTGVTNFSIASGLDVMASLWGHSEEDGGAVTSSVGDIRAGVIGTHKNDIGITEVLNSLKYSRGEYGGLFTSLKNMGADFNAIRFSGTGSGDEVMSLEDYFVVLLASRTGIQLPANPDHGMYVGFRNGTGGSITSKTQGGSGDVIVNTSNANVTSESISNGATAWYLYHGPSQSWYRV